MLVVKSPAPEYPADFSGGFILVNTKDVLVQQHHTLPPILLDIILQLHSHLTVIVYIACHHFGTEFQTGLHVVDCCIEEFGVVNAMDAMVDAYLDGCEIVYGVRSKRDTDTFFKRFTAEGFYKLLSAMGAEVVFNHADYRLISSRALQELAKFREVNLYLRGMVPLVGFKSTSVSYERHERIAGESHYPLKKMLGLAFDGITSLSVKPIRMVFFAGLFITILSFIGIIWAVIAAIAGHSVAGWASLACLVCFVGGMQCLFLGIIGEYIGKIYLEVKQRPRYIISERTAEMDEKKE